MNQQQNKIKFGECPVDHNEPSRGTSDIKSPAGCPVSHEAAEFDPFDKPYQVNPADAMKWFRNQEPVFYSPKLGYWIVTRYEDIKAVFRDNITFSPSIALERLTPFCKEAQDILESYNYGMDRTLVNEDEPAHMERRRVLMSYFQPEELAKHRPSVQKLATEYVDRFIEKGEADLVNEMLWEIPLMVAMHFLGIDESDMAKLRKFSVAHTLNTWGRPTPEEQIEVAKTVGEFWKLSGEILEKMKTNPPGNGWMHYHISQQKEYPEVITDSYLHSMMMAIIGAAHETTANSTSNAMRLLLSDRKVWELLCENPELIPNAVEECLRYEGAIIAWRRNATCDTKVGGVNIPKDAKILMVSVSGNHDEQHFENPDELDIFRDNSSEHLTFGYGAHQCLGKNIGRMEMCVFIEEFVRRIPNMKLVEDQEFEFLPNISFKGPENLYVKWDPTQNPEKLNPEILQHRREFPVGAPVKDNIARHARIKAVIDEADGVKRFVIEDAHGRTLPSWSAGSHIDILIGGYERKYSLCGAMQNTSTYEIAILKEEQGRGGSQYIHENLTEGMDVKIRGPKNHFRMEEEGERYILIAGGIGITPILAMADRLKKIGKPYEIHYAGSQLSTMAMMDRLTTDHKGHITLYAKASGGRMKLALLLADIKAGARVFACGPDRMIDALEELSVNWPEKTLLVEHFSSAKSQLDPTKEHSFKVELTDSDITINVPADKTLLEALTEAGVDVQSDCGEGLCGSCECTVKSGDIDHRDKVLTKEERAVGGRMMACCSRTKVGNLVLAL